MTLGGTWCAWEGKMRVAEGKKRKKQIDLRQLSVYLILHPEQAGKSHRTSKDTRPDG
jgi:hypothetical protein